MDEMKGLKREREEDEKRGQRAASGRFKKLEPRRKELMEFRLEKRHREVKPF